MAPLSKAGHKAEVRVHLSFGSLKGPFSLGLLGMFLVVAAVLGKTWVWYTTVDIFSKAPSA